MDYEERLANLDKHIAQGTLLRKKYGDGYNQACLLTALAPECAKIKDPGFCPTSVMPLWLAYCVPSIDDYGSALAWDKMVRRFAQLAHQWHILSLELWEGIKWRWLNESILCLAYKNANESNTYTLIGFEKVIQTIRDLCAQAAVGNMASIYEWKKARNEVCALAIDKKVPTVMGFAAQVAAMAINSNNDYRAVVDAVDAAAKTSSPGSGNAAAWDKMTNDLFDIIESEIMPTVGVANEY